MVVVHKIPLGIKKKTTDIEEVPVLPRESLAAAALPSPKKLSTADDFSEGDRYCLIESLRRLLILNLLCNLHHHAFCFEDLQLSKYLLTHFKM